MERSPQLLDIISKSFEGFKIPVKIGHLLVRKTAAFRWSVEHAVAGWSSAILVSKWVYSIEIGVFAGIQPTAAESKLLTTIREALEEAECELSEASCLSAAVAKTWGWFMHDVWIWGITPRMGEALNRLAIAYTPEFFVGAGSLDLLKTGLNGHLSHSNFESDLFDNVEDIIFTMLPEGSHVRAVYLDPVDGILHSKISARLLLDCSTIDTETSLAVSTAVKSRFPDVAFYDAPVSGGTLGAVAASLTLMVGCSENDSNWSLVEGLLGLVGKNIIACGGPGMGLTAKLCNNYCSGLISLATAEAMNIGMRSGMDPRLLSRVFSKSTAQSTICDKFNPVPGICPDAPSSHGYRGGFKVQLMAKDFGAPELAAHVRGALRNGASEVEIRETLLQAAIYSDSELVREKVRNWHQTYGDVFYTKVGATDYVWLSSPKAVKDLMDKKSAIYSSRPRLPLAQDVASGGSRQLFMAYGQDWRNLRKHSHSLLNLNATKKYRSTQELESRILLQDLLNKPDQFYTINRRYSTSVILLATYGYRIPSFQDPLITKIFTVLEHFSVMMAPGAFAVEVLPALARLPERFFGNWRTWGRNAFAHDSKVYLELWQTLKQTTDDGSARDCFCKDFYLGDPKRNGIDDLLAAYTCGGLVEAGAETTATTINNWTLAMILFPDVMRKGQEELDRVVGSGRLPTWDDEKNLPYIRAMIKETLRWRPVNKFGMYHASTEDDWYDGFFIPKGSTVVLNWWYALPILRKTIWLMWSSKTGLFNGTPVDLNSRTSLNLRAFLSTLSQQPST
ncbi:Cytochrome P450 monooxygenase atE [Colletotrichum fructicola]|nr:Cytochrome P450 monooxygenase atE [Colletotrichum fructicola]